MNEIFKDIPNYEGFYQVSDMGNVKSLSRSILLKGLYPGVLKERILKPSTNSVGYKQVVLSKDSVLKTFTVHQLIAMAFLDHVPDGYNSIIDHIDNDKNNNTLTNIQITDIRHNTAKDLKNTSSEYVGARWHIKNKTWTSAITINGKSQHLGTFKSEYEAHLAYIEAKNNLKQQKKKDE